MLLVQLPPSFAFQAEAVERFFALHRDMFNGAVVCEPRHASWFTPDADHALATRRVARAAADPARLPHASYPGGWLGVDGDGRGALVYYRWHGSPRMYWSRYESAWVQARGDEVALWPVGTDCWCIFDNTAGGQAISNALELQSILEKHSVDRGEALP